MFECKTDKRNSQCEHGQPMAHTRLHVLHVQRGCGSLSITTPVSYLANEFDVRSKLHGQLSSIKFMSFKACFENLNIGTLINNADALIPLLLLNNKTNQKSYKCNTLNKYGLDVCISSLRS